MFSGMAWASLAPASLAENNECCFVIMVQEVPDEKEAKKEKRTGKKN